MDNNTSVNIDEETIRHIGLRPSDQAINAQIAPGARIFIYPYLENVYVMENDLYGNRMPQDSCFIVFNGQHGLMGKHITVETLRNSTLKEIKNLVESHQEG